MRCPRRRRVSGTNWCPRLGAVAWIRRVRTASGATAVQIAEYDGGRRKIVAHVGSARDRGRAGDPAGAGAGDAGRSRPGRVRPGHRARRAAGPARDAGGRRRRCSTRSPLARRRRLRPARVLSTDSRLLFQALDGVYGDLGFGALGDDVFRDLVLARVVEPTSILDAGRVLADLGRKAASEQDHAPHPGPLRGPRLPRPGSPSCASRMRWPAAMSLSSSMT